MFTDSAQWYDLLYAFKDYAGEADQVMKQLERIHPHAGSILDVACGTGSHDSYLAEKFRVDGLDINTSLLAIAQTKNPHGKYHVGDMTDFSLPDKYDIILCLFSSIGYVKTLDNLDNTLRCFKRHLNPGGAVLLEPWFTAETWRPGTVHMLTAETEDGKICRMSSSQRNGTLSVMMFHYLVGTPEGVQHFTELHELGLFSGDQMISAFEKNNFKIEYNPVGIAGRGMYVGKL
jgi:ubiquinone/menaquinone biosynthesis C-methylase UbiE